MKSIWGCIFDRKRKKKQALIISRRKYGGNRRVGKENSFPKLEERFLSRQLSKPFQLMQWDAFKLPMGLCNEIEVLIRKFWWGQRGEKRKIHWLKWGEMTKSKSEGGMGFHDLALHNDSLLAKQAWCLLQDKSSLFYKVFKAHFFPNCTIMEATKSRHGFYTWKRILHGRDVIKRGACWRIGNGQKV